MKSSVIRFGWAAVLASMTGLALAQAAKPPRQAQPGQAEATEEDRGQRPDALPVELRGVFDTSEEFVPPHDLQIVDRPIAGIAAEEAAELAQAEQGISITPDGTVERIPLPEGIEAAFRDMLRAYDAAPGDEMGGNENLVTPESVIGEDTRVRVTNTTAFPYRTAGRIDIGCTGTLIGPRHVLTAGHCVYNINTDKWYTNLNFTPGQNGNSKPYGTITWKKAISVVGWTENHDRNYDYAIIVLNQDIGPTVGTMSFGYDNSLPMYNVNINGYPGDKPTGTQWHSFGALKIIQPFRLYHDCDTFGGNSGSGVYVYIASENKRTIYGIHAYGVDSTGYNGATRINKARYDNLNKWIAEN